MDVMLKDADLDNDGHSFRTLCELINGDVDHDRVFQLDMLNANL